MNSTAYKDTCLCVKYIRCRFLALFEIGDIRGLLLSNGAPASIWVCMRRVLNLLFDLHGELEKTSVLEIR